MRQLARVTAFFFHQAADAFFPSLGRRDSSARVLFLLFASLGYDAGRCPLRTPFFFPFFLSQEGMSSSLCFLFFFSRDDILSFFAFLFLAPPPPFHSKRVAEAVQIPAGTYPSPHRFAPLPRKRRVFLASLFLFSPTSITARLSFFFPSFFLLPAKFEDPSFSFP